ncbi:hypothetical protein [Longispora urticae]
MTTIIVYRAASVLAPRMLLRRVLATLALPLLLAACTGTPKPAPVAAPSPTPTMSACDDIAAAYTRWGIGLPADAAAVKALAAPAVRTLASGGKGLAGTVRTHGAEGPVKALADAVDEYNKKVSALSADTALAGSVGDANANDLVTALGGVRAAYTAYRTAAC